MSIIKRCFLTFLGILISVSAVAQVPELVNNSRFRPDAKAAVDSIYNFNFDGADKALSPWMEKYPDHPLWSLMEGMKFWWQILSDLQDSSHDEEFIDMMKKANHEAGELLHQQSTHADALLIQAISNGYIGRQYSNRDEWISSINYARKAMKTYKYLNELQPDMDDLKLAEGLKLYYAAYLPEAYPVVKTVSWFLPDGDKEKGLNVIREASREAIFARAEATYFLGNINFNYEKNYAAAVRNFEKLVSQYPRNNYYARILVKSYYHLHKDDKALAFIDQTLKRWRTQSLPYLKVLEEELLTWRGRILERHNQPDDALKSYKQAFDRSQQLPNPKGRSFGVASAYLAGDILYDQKKFSEAEKYLRKAIEADAESGYRERARNLLSKAQNKAG